MNNQKLLMLNCYGRNKLENYQLKITKKLTFFHANTIYPNFLKSHLLYFISMLKGFDLNRFN